MTFCEAHVIVYMEKLLPFRVKEYLHPTNGEKLGTPVVELVKGWKKLRRRAIP